MYKLTDNLDLDSACIPPQTLNNSEATGTGIFMGDAVSVVIACYAGAVATGGAVAWHIEESDAVGGSYANLSGKTAAHTDAEDNTIKLIEVRSDELTNGKDYIRLIATETGTQNALICGFFIKNAKSKPA